MSPWELNPSHWGENTTAQPVGQARIDTHRKMLQKGKYQYDYEDDYYDDADNLYDYDEYYNYGCTVSHGNVSNSESSARQPGSWCCTVCKCDNPGYLSTCDICGVIRNASVADSPIVVEESKANDMCKAPQVSLLAKSLFAAMPPGKPKMARIFQQLSDDLPSREADSSQGIGLVRAKFHDIQKSFAIPDITSRSINIVPFKFDTPSPDDVVSAGKHATGKGGAVKSHSSSALSKTSSSITGEVKRESYEARSAAEKLKGVTSSPVPQSNVKHKHTGNGFPRQPEASSDGTLEGLQNLNLGARTCQMNNSTLKKPVPLEKYKPESWMLHEQKEHRKNLLHLAIVGHVDAGKSTLMGRLLHLMGRVSQKQVHKYEREAKQKGRGSFAYAWILDESVEERERGVTMTVAVAHFESQKFHIVLLDSPGHKDFVPNMISGASQADAAVLVVDASIGAFEAGMYGQGEGQTKEHAQLTRSFGAEQLIIAVNKMDAVDNSEERFCFIKSQLGPFLRRCGFKESSIIWIPLSAIENQNLVSTASDSHLKSWYSGPCLLEAIDHLQLPTRDISRPLRLPISEVLKSHTLGQVATSGKLEAGAIKIGTKVLVMPIGAVGTVKVIEQDGRGCSVARAGDSVDVGLQEVDISLLTVGEVLCHPDFPVPVATCVEMKVVILEITMPVLVGTQLELHVHHAKEAARVVKLVSILDPKTGMVRKKAPRCLTANQSALIEVVPERGVCLEEYSNYRALGRVTLRAAGKTVAVGIVTRIIEQQ